MLVEELLQTHRITLSDLSPGRHYAVCPNCSSTRTGAHRTRKCLGVTIEPNDKAFWGCNHCGWTGPEKGAGAKANGAGKPELTPYVYLDASGVERFRKVRNLPGREPRFWLEQPDGRGGWLKNTKGVDTKILYRADEVAKAIAEGRVILVAEGEKDCDNLWRLGFPATCNAHGASEFGKDPKWYAHHSAQLKGAEIVVFNDCDGSGYAHADTACKLSLGVAARVRRLDLKEHWPEIPKGGDVSDWLAQGHGRDELAVLIDGAPDYASGAAAKTAETSGAAKRALEPTDDQIAEAFAEEHRNDLRFVAAWGKWFEWRGGCWREEKTLRAFDLIRKTCKAQGIQRVGMAKMVGAVHALARTDRRLAATIAQWDADPMLLNTPDGVIDLRTGTLRRHRAEDYMTMIAAIGPRGACPKWKAFLDKITAGEKALVDYLQRVAGYCLTADTGEQAMFFGHGVGANGKGVFLHTIGRVLGDYCKTAAIETFTESKSDRHPTELARLYSARLVVATETEKGRHWAEARIKMLTGGDVVTAHFMRQDDFEYAPKFKLFFSGNHKPGLRSVGEAMRRRVNMIPFAVVIPKDERDPHFGDKLEDEWSGILQWMIDGCLDWQEHGLAPPEAVTKATDEYFTAQDSFSLWVEDRCGRNPNAWTKTTELFASWKDWAEKAGVRFGTMTEFDEVLTKEGFTWKHTEKGNGYWGLLVRHDQPPPHWQEADEGR